MNASSLSFAGSISAKNGTRRKDSYSCTRLTLASQILLLPRSCLFFCFILLRSARQSTSPCGRVRKILPALPVYRCSRQNPIEVSRQAGAVQSPDQAAPGHLLPQAVGDLRLCL